MSGILGAVLILALCLVGALVALAHVVPEWLDERRRRRASDEAAERLRQRVREVRAEADAAKDSLARCQTAAAHAEAAARKAGDSVALANELIAEAKRESRD